MGWFKHRHWWCGKNALNTIEDEAGRTTGALILEDCACGAVRQIEFKPGVDPVVRITPAPATP
jgi:hypothetical protein